MREEPHNVVEVYSFILLQEPDNISFAARLDKVLEVPRLGIVHLQFGFNLADCVQRVHLADRYLELATFLFDQAAEEISRCW